jgi:hypothetical protein
MTSSTLSNNGHVSRKTLSTQIERLDSMLDGLAENLNDAVALAVKDVVGQVVRDAVEVAVKEVLSSPALLRAALAQQAPPTPPVQSTPPKPERRSLTDRVQSGWKWLCTKATQTVSHVKKKLGQGLAWCLEKLRQGCVAIRNRGPGWVAGGAGTMAALGTAGLLLWRFRQSCSVALAAGLVAGVSSYCAGPLLRALLSGLGGLALTLATLSLLPCWSLRRTSNASNGPD